MAYQRKVWQNRISEYFNRYRMQRSSGQSEDVFLTLNDGAVVQEGDSLTSEQLNDLEARIQYGFETSGGIGNCNPNLLDNPWFTVNQRGFNTTSGSTTGYHFDRWYGNYNFDTDTNGMKLGNSETATQYLDDKLKNSLDGKPIIFAVLYSDGVIASGSIEYEKAPEQKTTIFQDDNLIASIDTNGAITVEGLQTCVIVAMKLEVGEISTIAYDSPPNLAVETAKCRASLADTNDDYANQKLIHNNGYKATETGMYTHAEGNQTLASNLCAHAEGYQTKAVGSYSHAEGYQTTANGYYSHAEGYYSHAQGSYSHAQGYYGMVVDRSKYLLTQNNATDSAITNVLTRFAQGLDNLSDVVTAEKGLHSDTQLYNGFSLDGRGSIYAAGAQSMYRGYIDGVLVANGPEVQLEDGAMYILYVNGRNKANGAWRGAQSFLVEATFNPAGIGTTTSAQAVPHWATLGSVGTTPIALAARVKTEEVESAGTTTTIYHSVLGIGSCTTAFGVRWSIVKVLGSEADFAPA